MRKGNKMNKSILIVAAERGLGLGLAQQFFKRGWDVVGTSRPGAKVDELRKVGATDPDRMAIGTIDVTDAAQIEPFLASLGDRRFDVVFMNAGIWGAEHQSVLEATDQEFAEIMLTNTFGPMRLARHLLNYLAMPGGTLAFMSSHRGSIAINVEGGLELYRASKVASNMLARGIYLAPSAYEAGFVSTRHGPEEIQLTLDAASEAFAEAKAG